MKSKNNRQQKLEAFGKLLDVIDTLREQCPWDSVQTNESMRPNTIEEAMELAEALLGDDKNTIKKELGDVLLHVLLYARIGEETGDYDIAEVCDSLRQKLIFRPEWIKGGAMRWVVCGALPVAFLLLSTAALVGNSYNPFLYFKF